MNSEELDNTTAELEYKAACLMEDFQALRMLFESADAELRGCDHRLSDLSIACFASRYSLYLAAWSVIERDALEALNGMGKLHDALEQLT